MRRVRFSLSSVICGLALLAATAAVPGLRPGAVHAAAPFSFSSYIKTCPSATPDCNADLTSITVDPVWNVVYAIDQVNDSGSVDSRLVRVDGNTDTFHDSVTLPNCAGAKRPAVAHANGLTKIYIGCEDQPDVLVLKVAGRFGAINTTNPTRIRLHVQGDTTDFEPKTERANDPLGLIYVVGDNPGDVSSCSPNGDPAFVISARTDTEIGSNTMLGSVDPSGCGRTGINDVAVGVFTLYWFNEDDQRIYSTDMLANITRPLVVSRTRPVVDQCSENIPEDAPKFGAVTPYNGGLAILATAPESMSPCDPIHENGGIYAWQSSPSPLVSKTAMQYAAGPVAGAPGGFLVANGESYPDAGSASSRPTCFDASNNNGSCVSFFDAVGNEFPTIPLVAPQSDVTYNPVTGKAYLSLDTFNQPDGADKQLAVLQKG